MAQLTLVSRMDSRNSVLCSPDSELRDIVLETFRLIDFDTTICKRVETDLDNAALAAKKRRGVASAERAAGTPFLAGLLGWTVADAEELAIDKLELARGRPRNLDGEAALVLAVCRAHLDSLTSRQAVDRIRDSIAVNAYFTGRGRGMPSRSAMHAWINAIAEDSYEYIFTAHLRMVRGEGLDDLSRVSADSFSVQADTAWPTDSGMILKLLSRAWRRAEKLPGFGLPTFAAAYIPLWLDRIRGLDREISFACGKPGSRRKIRRLYRQLCTRADLLMKRLDGQMGPLLLAWQVGIAELPAFTRQRAETVAGGILSDLADAARVVAYAWERVLHGTATPSTEKVLSVSDRSAAYIKKGGREAVIGYKPQVMRSDEGFITAFELQEGNPADAARLMPLTEQHVTRTGIVPVEVSVDDGYSSANNRKALQKLGVETISMNGSKGKKITPPDQWDSIPFQEARSKRSAVESLVFTLRFKFHLYRFSRRGIAAVRSEIYEKAIAHNLWRAALLRRRKAAKRGSLTVPDAA